MKKPYRLFTLTAAILLSAFSTQADERIISAGSAVTELVFALGAQEQLVAADVTSKFYIKESDIPQVGYHRRLSPEGLLALNPSYLIGSDEMGPESTLENLTASKVNVVKVPSGDSLSDLYDRIDTIAEITGTQNKAPKLKQKIATEVGQLESLTVENPPKVMFLMLNKGRPANVGGKETTIDRIITLSGASNPASNLVSSYKPISMEAIVKMQPDYLLVSNRAWKSLEGEKGILKNFPLLAATPAGQKGKIVAIPGRALVGGFGLESIELSKTLANKYHQP